MFDKTPYTPGMREVLKLSKAEAGRLGHDYIGPEHYLLGVIRKGDGLAIQTLMNLDVDLEDVKLELERMVDVGKGPTVGLFSPNTDAKRVLETSKAIANELRHGWVGTEHLMLGLIREEETVASMCLRQFGVDYEKALKEVIQVIESGDTRSKSKTSHVSVRPKNYKAAQDRSAEHGVASRRVIGKTRYTAGMHEIVTCAKFEAGRLWHKYIGPEHLLLAAIRQADGMAVKALLHLGLNLEQIKLEIERMVGKGPEHLIRFLYLNADGKHVLKGSQAIASEMGHDWVGSEHLLLAILKQEESLAGKCLHQLGLGYKTVLEEVTYLTNDEEKIDRQTCLHVILTIDELRAIQNYSSKYRVLIGDVFRIALADERQWRKAVQRINLS